MPRPTTLNLPLRDIREAEGMSIEEAARKLGWDENILRQVERRGTVLYTRIKALSDLYRLSIDTIATAALPRK